MAQIRKPKNRNPKISIAAIAIDEGYHKGRLLRPDEKFTFVGELNKEKDGSYVLPTWVSAQDEKELDKLIKEIVKGEKPAKEAKPAASAAKANAASVMAAPGELV